MIYKDCIVTIKDNTASIDEDIVLYKTDKNIDLFFKIVNSHYKFSKSNGDNLLSTIEASYSQIKLKKNFTNDIKVTFPIEKLDNGKICLKITAELIDENTELGDYDIQIRLLDDNQNAIITLPVIENCIHVLNPIFEDVDNAIIGEATVGIAKVSNTEEFTNTYNDDGTYNKTNWNDGDLITANRLNKLELVAKDTVDKSNTLTTQLDSINESIGDKTQLNTTNKTSLVNAINEVFQSVSNGKTLIASAITDKGVDTSNSDTFQTMANNILSISSNNGPSEEVLTPLYSFGVMSDIHMPTTETSDDTIGYNYTGRTKFENAVSELKGKVSFICSAGDLSSYAYNSQAPIIKEIVDNQGVTFYSCNGNHDPVYSSSANTNWNTMWGHDMNYVFEKDDDVFMFLSLMVGGSSADNPYGTNIDWLESQLNVYKNKRIFLFMHYPITGYAGLKTNEQYGFSANSTEDERILGLLKQHLNVHCFSGHTHYVFGMQETYPNINVYKLDYFNVTLIHTPSLTQPRDIGGNMPDTTTNSKYIQSYIVDVYSDNIIIHAYDIVNKKDLYTYKIETNADYTKSNYIELSTYNVAIDEGNTSNEITVSLNHAPIKDVVVNINSNSEFVTVNKSSIRFTPSNYSTTLTVSAVDDGTTADYTCLLNLTSESVAGADINVAVTNTTVIDNRTKYDLSFINSAITKPFILPDNYPYVYITSSAGDAYCTSVEAFTTSGTSSGTLMNGTGQKWKWNSSTSEWYLYKSYDATNSRTSLGVVSHCNTDFKVATITDNVWYPTGEIILKADIFPI